MARGKALIDFTYKDDPQGLKCPITSHLRRVNTRDGLAPTGTEGSVLNNRRRILRRGLPYGNSSEGVSDSDEHGVVMLVGLHEPVSAVRVRATAMDQLRP